MKEYRGKISYLLPILFIPLLITIGVIIDNDFPTMRLLFVWIPFLLLVCISLGYKIKIGEDFIKSSFLNFKINEIHRRNFESMIYGEGLGLWGTIYPSRPTTHGKGLVILANIDGVRKAYGFSEKLYGKEAIQQIKIALEH